jgi:glycosyltransferase involved in cell wall biosynthesis
MRDKLPPVLVIADHLGYAAGVAHGLTTYFLQVLPALADRGVNLQACFLRERHSAAEVLCNRGITPIFLAAGKWDPLVVFRIAALAREHRSRIVHASGIKATLVARAVVRMVGAGTIVHVHDLVYPSTLLSGLHRILSRPTDLGICVSQAVREVAVNGYHLHQDRLRVVHNGVRLADVRSVAADTRFRIREALNIPRHSNVIAMIARMYPVKGHRSMLQMLPFIIERCPDVVLVLAGDGPERPACEAMTGALALHKHVRFLGHRDDVPELLAASDLFVMPSQTEGLGLAAIEALAAGRPVVGFAVGGLREVVSDGEDGRLVKLGDQKAFVDAVVCLLKDRELLQACGDRAVVASERFSLELHVGRLMECYEEAAQAA